MGLPVWRAPSPSKEAARKDAAAAARSPIRRRQSPRPARPGIAQTASEDEFRARIDAIVNDVTESVTRTSDRVDEILDPSGRAPHRRVGRGPVARRLHGEQRSSRSARLDEDAVPTAQSAAQAAQEAADATAARSLRLRYHDVLERIHREPRRSNGSRTDASRDSFAPSISGPYARTRRPGNERRNPAAYRDRTGAEDAQPDRLPMLRRMAGRRITDGPLPSSSLRESWSPGASTVDGLGDRERSLSPPDQDHWETVVTTITPDATLPSADSSFTSAAASASFSAPTSNSHSHQDSTSHTSRSGSAASNRTHITVPSQGPTTAGYTQPGPSGCETSEEENDEDANENGNLRGPGNRRNPTSHNLYLVRPRDPITLVRVPVPTYDQGNQEPDEDAEMVEAMDRDLDGDDDDDAPPRRRPSLYSTDARALSAQASDILSRFYNDAPESSRAEPTDRQPEIEYFSRSPPPDPNRVPRRAFRDVFADDLTALAGPGRRSADSAATRPRPPQDRRIRLRLMARPSADSATADPDHSVSRDRGDRGDREDRRSSTDTTAARTLDPDDLAALWRSGADRAAASALDGDGPEDLAALSAQRRAAADWAAVRAAVAASVEWTAVNDSELEQLRRIVAILAGREDVPEEFWRSAGLGRLGRDGEGGGDEGVVEGVGLRGD